MSRTVGFGGIMAATAVALLLSGGCSPTEVERAHQKGRETEVEQRENLRRALGGATEESVAIKLVQSAPAAQGEGTMEQWVQRHSSSNGSSIFFPRWEASRRGLGKFEVAYTYTTVQEDGLVGKRGVAWLVDIVLKKVTPPREMKQDELAGRSSRYMDGRRKGMPTERTTVK